jgi:GTP pyrophosphokinase
MSIDSLLSFYPDLKVQDREMIERAYRKAEVAHEKQFRKSGEPYFTHCVAVATILAELKLDAEAIAAALMHDILEDTRVVYDELREEFGSVVANLVESVTKIDKLPSAPDRDVSGKRKSVLNRETEYYRKMLLAMGDDVRVVLIKLADRLHNMRTLGYMKEDKQQTIARETLEIFAPLANRLGIWQIKWELEDLCMRYLEPEAYRSIARKIDERRADREQYMRQVVTRLHEHLERGGIEGAVITGRPKHIFSIYKKMQEKNRTFDQIYDVRAVRVIVNTDAQCYHALGIVHSIWRPIPEQFDDYIAAPKENFYKSLHTAVRDENGKELEVQIRTLRMHEDAEYGIAAHWRYKEAGKKHDEAFQKRLLYLRRLMEFGPEGEQDPEAFMENMIDNVFAARVYVFTPKGDIVDLPTGSTPIDFAYHIHTEIGHRCRGARVGGSLVGLDYKLKTGDQIEIITANRGGPSMDWLNEDLGYVQTQRARQKIHVWFRKLNRDKHITLGREIVERELKRLGLGTSVSLESVATMYEYSELNEFLAAVGAGDITGAHISSKVLEEEHKRQQRESLDGLLKVRPRSSVVVDRSNGVRIMGTGGLLTNIATCCGPVPGDEIVGFITRGRGVTIHRADCRNILNTKDTERIIEVSWGDAHEEQRYSVPIEIVAYDRAGLLRDVSTVIADEKISIADVRLTTRQDIAVIHVVLDITSYRQITRVLTRLGMIRSVTEVYRCQSG